MYKSVYCKRIHHQNLIAMIKRVSRINNGDKDYSKDRSEIINIY